MHMGQLLRSCSCAHVPVQLQLITFDHLGMLINHHTAVACTPSIPVTLINCNVKMLLWILLAWCALVVLHWRLPQWKGTFDQMASLLLTQMICMDPSHDV